MWYATSEQNSASLHSARSISISVGGATFAIRLASLYYDHEQDAA